MAVGNGLVGVAVNSVLTFYRASDGAPLSAPIPARDLLAVGFPAKDPYLLDPSLSYDPEVGRWFYSVARLETNERGALTGGSSIEMAVSGGADPFFEADGGGVLWVVRPAAGRSAGAVPAPRLPAGARARWWTAPPLTGEALASYWTAQAASASEPVVWWLGPFPAPTSHRP